MAEMVELGKVSSRGQVAIPIGMRKEMGLEDGVKIMFFLEDDTLLIKKVAAQTWEEVTRPLRAMKKKIRQNQVNALIHRMRRDERGSRH